jgi:hypothetical protein
MLSLLDNYTIFFANISNGYNVPLSPTRGLTVNHFGFDLVAPIIEPNTPFALLLDANPSLNASFSKQLITGILFRDINFTYNSNISSRGNNWYFKWYFDLSGLEVMTANWLYNKIADKNVTFNINELDFSHYAKTEVDGRRYWRFGNEKMVVTRVSGGIGLPYYRSTSVPYIRQFFVGGPYSIRGWYTRELGPGLYRDPITVNASNRCLFYQAGDIKIEFNLEYRFLITSPLGMFKLYGATFLDGGNIWTRKYDPDRVGSKFATKRKVDNGLIVQDNFLREIGMSTGFGFRMDFNYFVLRIDLGLPVRNNFPDSERNNRYWIPPGEWFPLFFPNINTIKDNFRYQLAMGYPF